MEDLGDIPRSATSAVKPGLSAVAPDVACTRIEHSSSTPNPDTASSEWFFFPHADADTPLVRLDASKHLAEGIYRVVETADGSMVYIHVADCECKPGSSLGDAPEKARLAYQARTGAPDSEVSDFINTLFCTPNHSEEWPDR